MTMTRMLDKVLRRSDTIDKESLCVIAGQRVSPIYPPVPSAIAKVLGLACSTGNPLFI